ncbi:MAG: hypothetical protein CFE44_06230 [Burkholderiales bacterium PBB4]|nr:MAG: hypothetical protein CFE44_06230 [Burkholderiales bacterium PBB4]
MKVSENIIIDLLPAYFAQEASADTCALVDAYFAEHPAFAATMRASQNTATPHIGSPQPGSDVQAFRRVQSLLRWRSSILAAAIFCSLAPFSFVFQDGTLTWSMLRDAPGASLAYGAAAVVAWGAYISLKRHISAR